ncbi:unnamed protein product, partial [Polarella glacialis]
DADSHDQQQQQQQHQVLLGKGTCCRPHDMSQDLSQQAAQVLLLRQKERSMRNCLSMIKCSGGAATSNLDSENDSDSEDEAPRGPPVKLRPKRKSQGRCFGIFPFLAAVRSSTGSSISID